MSAGCRFCGQEFANAQAVRAHLKGCAAYRASRQKPPESAASLRQSGHSGQSLGREDDSLGNAEAEAGFSPVHQFRQQLAAERIRLQLREVEEAHAELDRREEAKTRDREQEAERQAENERLLRRERENAQRTAEETRRARERQEAAARERASQRRAIVQKVKDEATTVWRLPLSGRADLKAQALKAIEAELSALPVEDIPYSELLLIAEGARDKVYREPLAAQQRAQANAANRVRLIRHGNDYAGRELRATEGLSVSERWTLERLVREELETATGEETPAEIEDWVDEILEANGIGWDEDDA